MLIDFNNTEETKLIAFCGGEKELVAKIFNDDNNKILYGKLVPGASIGMHTHETGSEIIYILSGSGKAIFDDSEESLGMGSCHYCPKGHSHSLINNGNVDLIFFAVIPKQ